MIFIRTMFVRLPEWACGSEVARVDFPTETIEFAKVASSVPREALCYLSSSFPYCHNFLSVWRPLQVRHFPSNHRKVVHDFPVLFRGKHLDGPARVATRNPLAIRRKPKTKKNKKKIEFFYRVVWKERPKNINNSKDSSDGFRFLSVSFSSFN